MADTEMLRLLQMFFDGTVMSISEVIRQTGLPDDVASAVYEAINRLRSMDVG